MSKLAVARGIYLDWVAGVRSDITASQWEGGVLDVIQDLLLQPCQTSTAVLDAIGQTGKTVTVSPERQPLLPGKSDANAHADPVDPVAATIAGGTPDPPQNPLVPGTGRGSEVVLKFTAQDWEPSSSTASLKAVDETLLHELVHASRQTSGLEDSLPLEAPFEVLRRGSGSVSQLMTQTTSTRPNKHSQIYNEYEEFVAILVTNIYRSENKRVGLRRDHLGDFELAFPLTNARNFLTVWRPQIDRLCGEMHLLCNQLAAVECHFNPIFELYAALDRFLPGGRRVS